MPITFHPARGAILICRFGEGGVFQPPEMMKARPVVVISPRRRTGQLATVVPLSSSAPERQEPWHHQLSPAAYPPARGPMWAKCDMVATVAHARLDRVRFDRQHQDYSMPAQDMVAIMAAVSAALGMR